MVRGTVTCSFTYCSPASLSHSNLKGQERGRVTSSNFLTRVSLATLVQLPPSMIKEQNFQRLNNENVEIGNGLTTSFWYDVWSPLGRLIDLTGSRGSIDLGIHINTNVEMEVQTYRRRRHRVSVLVQIEDEILSLRSRGLSQVDDDRLWKTEADGFKAGFSSKQTWHITRLQFSLVPWCKGIWFSGMTPKYAFMAWIVMHDRLSTRHMILKWNMQADAQCLLCKNAMESRDHLYFLCSYTEMVWMGLLGKLLGTRYSNQWNQIQQILVNGSRDAITLFLVRYSFQLVVYSVWRKRNARRVEDRELSSTELLQYLDRHMRNRISTL
ncbi:hypothetical protein N665_0019s0054 [Sinapis alba]|nr:hypothetical protein N665_0019s0054 [Sinapis alba]